MAATSSSAENWVALLGTKGGPAIRPGSTMPTSNLLCLDGRMIVVDCGLGVARGLTDQGMRLTDLSLIFITHLHSDHYLELDYDLSNVLFITTANSLYPIPSPLQDRMEVIEFSGYIEEEKLEIARQFIIPRQIEENGLEGVEIRVADKAIQGIIREYTYEAGVRNLEREIGRIFRKITRRLAEKKSVPKLITRQALAKYLGPPRFTESKLNDVDEVGIATGIAYT